MSAFNRKFHYKELDSTSTFLKRRRQSFKNFTFVSCDFQTDGHGRMGRTWSSNIGENLLFSILIKDDKLINNFSSLSLCGAVSVFKILTDIGIKDLSIKWPNDVFVKDKKICGILLESVSENNHISDIVIGFGLNVNSKSFLGEYKVPPTSIFLESNKPFSIRKLKAKLYRQIKKDFLAIKNGDKSYLDIARENNYLKNKKVYTEINGKISEILVKEIADNNALIYEIDGKEHRGFSGEITFHV